MSQRQRKDSDEEEVAVEPPSYGVAILQTVPYDSDDTLTEKRVPIGLIGPPEDTQALAKSFEAHIPSQAIEVEENRFKVETTVLDSLETVANPEVAADLGPTFADVTREGHIRTTQACMLVLFDLTLTDSFAAAVNTLEKMEAEMCGTPHMLIGCKAEQEARGVGDQRVSEIAARFGVEYVETSVSTGSNIEYVFKEAARLVAAQMERAGKDHRLKLAQGPRPPTSYGGGGGGGCHPQPSCGSIAEATAATLPAEPLPESEIADVLEVAKQFIADAEKDRAKFVAQAPDEVSAAEDGADFVRQIRAQTFRPEITSTPAMLEAEVRREYPTHTIQERAAQAHLAIEGLEPAEVAAGEAADGLTDCAIEAYTGLRDGLNELAFSVAGYAAIPITFQPETVLMRRTDQKASTQLRDRVFEGRNGFTGANVINGEEVVLLQLDGDWAEVQKKDDAKSSGWVRANHCVLRKMLQDTVAAEADELAKLIEKFRECDPEPVNTKVDAREQCVELQAKIALCKRRREAMQLLVELRPVVETIVKLNGEELETAETNLARDVRHKGECEGSLQKAAGRLASLAQLLEDESASVIADREHVANTINQIEAGHIEATTALRWAEDEFQRNEDEASTAIAESVHGGALTKRGLVGTFDYLLRRAARQSRERNEMLRKQAKHDARSRAVTALRVDADAYVEWTDVKLSKLEGTKEAVAAVQRLWQLVCDRLAAGFTERMTAITARRDELQQERYEMLCAWIKNFTNNVISPATHLVIIKHSAIAEAEAQVDEYDRALIPGIAKTELELDRAEAKLQQVVTELKDAEDSVHGYYAERKAYLDAAGYFALAEALSLSDVTCEHDEKTKAEINQAKLRLGRTRSVVALETASPDGAGTGSLQDAVDAFDSI